MWHTLPFGDSTSAIWSVLLLVDDGWLAVLTVTPGLGYAVSGQTRLVHIDRDGAVSEPELFRGGGVGQVLVDGRAVRFGKRR